MKTTTALLAVLVLLLPSSKILAQETKILAEDHFVENDRGWNLGEDLNVVRKIEDGKMTLECKKYLAGGGGYWIKMPDVKLPANNFSVSVTTHWIKNMKTDDTFSPYGLI